MSVLEPRKGIANMLVESAALGGHFMGSDAKDGKAPARQRRERWRSRSGAVVLLGVEKVVRDVWIKNAGCWLWWGRAQGFGRGNPGGGLGAIDLWRFEVSIGGGRDGFGGASWNRAVRMVMKPTKRGRRLARVSSRDGAAEPDIASSR